MRSRLTLAAALLAATALLAGCGKSTPNSPVAGGAGSGNALDRAAVASVVATQPEVVEDGQFEATDASSLAIGGGAGLAATPSSALAAIQPLRFWRVIRDVDRSFEFAFSDSDSTGRPTTAIVTVHKLLTGRFDILTGVPGSDSTAIDSTLQVLHKPLADHWVRRILLKRVMSADSTLNPWRVVATSAVKVTSRNAATQIVSLRVQTATLDTTITTPLAFFRLRGIPELEPGAPVTLTVTTLRNDDVVVLTRVGHRFRFHNNGDDTYTGVWTLPDFRLETAALSLRPRIFHFGVNALSNGTLFDDTAAYDSQAWILPVVLKPDQIADALP